jgi:hypothetical protein
LATLITQPAELSTLNAKEWIMVEHKEVKKAEAPKLVKKQHRKVAVSVKHPWTLERCVKAASRFTSVDEWCEGAPSSFKAAEAHGWLMECKKHLHHKPASRTYKKSA